MRKDPQTVTTGWPVCFDDLNNGRRPDYCFNMHGAPCGPIPLLRGEEKHQQQYRHRDANDDPLEQLKGTTPFTTWYQRYGPRNPYCLAYWAIGSDADELRVNFVAIGRDRSVTELASFESPHKDVAEYLRFVTFLVKLIPYMLKFGENLKYVSWDPELLIRATIRTTVYYLNGFGTYVEAKKVQVTVRLSEEGTHALQRFVFGADFEDNDQSTPKDAASRLAAHLTNLYSRTELKAQVTEDQNVSGCPVVTLALPVMRQHRGDGMPLTEVVKCFSDILALLAKLHDGHGLVHRDVRWPNIMQHPISNTYLLVDYDDAALLDEAGLCRVRYYKVQFACAPVDLQESYGAEIDVRALCLLVLEHPAVKRADRPHPIRDFAGEFSRWVSGAASAKQGAEAETSARTTTDVLERWQLQLHPQAKDRVMEDLSRDLGEIGLGGETTAAAASLRAAHRD